MIRNPQSTRQPGPGVQPARQPDRGGTRPLTLYYSVLRDIHDVIQVQDVKSIPLMEPCFSLIQPEMARWATLPSSF